MLGKACSMDLFCSLVILVYLFFYLYFFYSGSCDYIDGSFDRLKNFPSLLQIFFPDSFISYSAKVSSCLAIDSITL
jgi:hypothetical protein